MTAPHSHEPGYTSFTIDPSDDDLPEERFPSRFRFNLADCFFITAFVAVLAWCASIVGHLSPAFWVGLVTSLTIGFVVVDRLAKRKPRSVVWISLICLFVFGLVLTMIPVAISCPLYILVAMIAGTKSSSYRSWLRTSMTIIAVGFVAWLMAPNRRLAAIYEVREMHPVESLKQRLSYEHSTGALAAQAPRLNLSRAVTERLDLAESVSKEPFFGRNSALENAHSRQLESFVRANGFGASRMITPSKYGVEKPPLTSLAFDAGLSDSEENLYGRGWRFNDESFVQDFQSSTDKFHWAGVFDFLDPSAFGWIAGKQQAAGFIPHAFHGIESVVSHDGEQWRLQQLQLISLLKFSEPKAYVLDHLPRMDHLTKSDIETRSLDAFESESLKRLYTDEDLIMDSNANQLRMFGSIRASNVCLECHSVPRGYLLGAFTYRFESNAHLD